MTAYLKNYYLYKVKPYLRRGLVFEPLPGHLRGRLQRISLTLILSVGMMGLHIARHYNEALARVFESAAFRVGEWSASGVFLCGFFHTTFGHFSANWISFVVCVGLFEIVYGKKLTLAVLAFGFWASNPLTVLAVGPMLSAFAPAQMPAWLSEVDYGASNGIYAIMGGLSALLAAPRTLILPFIFNGVVFAVMVEQWLQLQHIAALFGGYWICKGWKGVRLPPA